MALNNYISLSNLAIFLNKLNNIFATKDEVNTKSDKTHTHAVADVSGLQSALNDKAAQIDLDALETIVEGKANTSHTHSIGNVTNLQTTLDTKQATITGAATTITGSNLTTNRALISNGSGKVAVSAVTSTELGYLDGVTSNVQTQLDGKSASGHTHSYAGSSSVGGAATSANKLNTNAGDTNTPVYFNNGIPVACTSLDLNTTGSSASCTGNAATASNVAWTGVTSKPSYYDAKAIKTITRNGTTFTYTCMDGTTGTFTQQDNNTTYSAATTSAAGLMSAADKTKLNGIATGANKITVDSAMSTTSTNPVQNKVVKAAIDKIALTVTSDGVLVLSV